MTVDPVSRRKLLALALALSCPVLAAAATEGDADLAGTWTWSWQDAQGQTHRHVLEVVAAGAQVAVRERFDELQPVTVNDLKVDGPRITFSVLRGERHAEYAGTRANPDTFNGTVTVTYQNRNEKFAWTAKRQQPSATP
ncbi:MAG TPA: hypothetical protein VF590_27470 [Isosphaeraceae bacterium]